MFNCSFEVECYAYMTGIIIYADTLLPASHAYGITLVGNQQRTKYGGHVVLQFVLASPLILGFNSRKALFVQLVI